MAERAHELRTNAHTHIAGPMIPTEQANKVYFVIVFSAHYSHNAYNIVRVILRPVLVLMAHNCQASEQNHEKQKTTNRPTHTPMHSIHDPYNLACDGDKANANSCQFKRTIFNATQTMEFNCFRIDSCKCAYKFAAVCLSLLSFRVVLAST